MTNTRTTDIQGTLNQISELAVAGCQIIRLAIPDEASVVALKAIISQSPLPVIADIHFDYRLAIGSIDAGVHALRLNPGNIGDAENVKQVAEAARKAGIPIRVGVNAGSLDKDILAKFQHPCPEALAASALRQCKLLESFDFFDIKVSLKSSNVPETVQAYKIFKELSDKHCEANNLAGYPLHLGITEAGTLRDGTLKSAIGIGALLLQGLGDTLRVSLTASPLEEVYLGRKILETIGLRQPSYELIACPTCGRTEINLIELAESVDRILLESPPIHPLKIAVMGCIVNGPGEAKEADIGIAGGLNCGVIFRKGKIIRKVAEEELLSALLEEIRNI